MEHQPKDIDNYIKGKPLGMRALTGEVKVEGITPEVTPDQWVDFLSHDTNFMKEHGLEAAQELLRTNGRLKP